MKHYVYFIQRADKCVKIGVTKNLERRLKTLQTANNKELLIVAKFPFDSRMQAFDMERQLHERFAGFRMQGEWFNPGVLKKIFTDALVDKSTTRLLKHNINGRRFNKFALMKNGLIVESKEFGITFEKDIHNQRAELLKKRMKLKQAQKAKHAAVIDACKQKGIETKGIADNLLVKKLESVS
jgi:T5orf172 domain